MKLRTNLWLDEKTGLPEHLKNIRGLFYSPTTENISGQMELAAGFASVEELKSYQTKSRSKNRPENKYWFKAALDLRNRLGLNRQLSIEDFNKVVDLYPTKRIVIYSSETNQPGFVMLSLSLSSSSITQGIHDNSSIFYMILDKFFT